MKKYRKSVFIITYTKVKGKIYYLLLKRKLHWKGWEFPKGGRKFFESKKQTVKREIKEETGLVPIKIKKIKISGKFKYNKKFPDRKGFIGQTYSLYAVEVKKKKIILDKLEHSDYKWLDLEKAIKKLHWPNQRKCLKIVDERLKHIKT
ncbi:NUDIX domain-containing protein [Candidatus Pacearchaeota archaeon]|nr:NUDIX domain-containing protein [Candidatus Pacearchaeota archaeon]